MPFTGRREELSLLHDTYINALHNECQTALVEGEPGVGKSTMVRVFLSELGPDSALTLRTYGAPSFGGFRVIFAGLLRSVLNSRTLGEISTANLFDVGSATALSRLAPEVRDVIPFDVPESPDANLGVTHEMEQILDGLRLFILRLATRKPLILLFEDAHWYDARCWEALSFLKRTLKPYPVMIIVTMRPTELDDDSQKIFNTIARELPVERLRLSSLNQAESRKLIERLFGAEVSDNIGSEVFASTGGNPLFLHETFNTLIERRLLQFDQHKKMWEQTVDLKEKLPAPESATHIFEERISGFSDEELNLFRLAALLGLSFQTEWLKDLSGLAEEKFIDTLNRALKANLLVSDFQGALSFYHQLVQRHLLDSIPADLLGELRRSIHEYFLRRERSHPQEGPFHRFLALEDYDDNFVERYGETTVERNLAAAEDAFTSFSTALAVRYLQTSRRIIDALTDLDRLRRLQLLEQTYLALGRIALESGRARQAVAYFRCVAIYLSPQLQPTPGERLRLFRLLAESSYKIAAYRRIARYVQQAAEVCGDTTDIDLLRELARVRFISGLSLYNQGQYDRAIEQTESGLTMLQKRGLLEPKLELTGLRTKGIILNRTGRHHQAEETFTRSLQLAETLNDRREIGRAHYYLGVVRQYLGRFNQAMESYQRSMALCQEVDDLETMSKIYNNLGVHYSESGDPDQAERNFRRALETQTAIGAVYASLTSRINIAGAMHTSGRSEEALTETRHILDECVRINAVNLIPAIYDSEVEIALDAGKLDYAERALKEMEQWLKGAESKFGLDQLTKLQGRLLILKGEYQTGWELLEQTIAIYQEKGESFRAAQTMAEGAFALGEAWRGGAEIPEPVLLSVEKYIRGALDIYRGLKFTRRIQTLREKIIRCDPEGKRFAPLLTETADPDLNTSERPARDRALLRCFGRLKVVCPGRHDEVEESSWPSKKARVLLAYLAINTSPNRPISRDKICDALWSHLGPDTIMSSFHVTLSHLRKTLAQESSDDFKHEELISHLDGNYTLNWDTRFWCDLREFDSLYLSGMGYLRENKTHLALRDYEAARALYQGPLLEDLYDSWLEAPRESYRRRYLEITQRLAEITFDRGEYERTLTLCQEALLVDPTEEPTHRLLMLALFTTGRKAAAVKQYNSCANALKERLEIEPDQKTIDFAEQIKNKSAELADLPPLRAKARFV